MMLMKIFEILLVALAMTIVMSWGYVKKQRQSEELLNQLMVKSEHKVKKAFMRTPLLSYAELCECLKGTKASLFWSKNKAIVQEPEVLLDQILMEMVERGEIIEGRQKTYQWVRGGGL